MQKTVFKEVRQKLCTLAGLLIGFSLFINLLVLAIPLYMLQVYNRVISSYSTDTLLLLTIIVLAALFTMSIIDIARAQMSKSFGFWMDAKLSVFMLKRSIQYQSHTGKSYTSQVLRDIQTIKSFLSSQAPYPLLDAPWTPLFILFVYLLHPFLGHIALLGSVVLFSLGLINELMTRKTMQESEVRAISHISSAELATQNANSILAMGMMNAFLEQWQSRVQSVSVLEERVAGKSTYMANFSKFVRGSLQIFLLGGGAWLVIQHEITAGAMIASSILMSRALSPMEQAIGTWRSAMSARTAYKRLKEIDAIVRQDESDMPLPKPKGHYELTGLTYRHPGATEPVLSSITLSIPPGVSVGVIGPSGTGKSTFARLLLGNIRPLAGKVTLDGMEVSIWASEDRGVHVGYLAQEVELFPGTIRENIARFKEEDPAKVIKAAQLAGCHELILKKNKGYDFVIGENGRGLSGGERQRIALARAVYGDPSIVVFDEANANLDGEGEAAYQRLIAYLKSQGSTIVVIAHNPSTLRQMDRLLCLADGRAKLYGARDEVLKRLMGEDRTDIPRVKNEQSAASR
ncbi:type I secretion system permease/ATPase [Vibrio parahaemolyticus]|uniref:type I secretion system permease/ATPase n=1 Tax=Vibrio parahaemolyticus TaxID=670 RepID=UPI0007A02029|nr:type I secretion system permease/ATPase [Vibrio parahaemolyticus]EGQ7741199.1 type I secretion system permease/ATPase [Vibrio parahaemolyticus]EIO3965847.1 type I secretion system permease/ATPase [Vibrio parahaemolyticus]EIO3988376.1 type I secretion system permease/ATPase [Vibrio parahaemolyticus]EJG1398385.1 type I secretion system permease/ATPase [Vibrio parahaemolyticus]ELA9841335.1 type I secretion system permease/ATPase [Vibrio parahaemolyticus]